MNQRRWVRLFDEPVFFWALAISALLSVSFGAEAIKSMMFVTPPNPALLSHFTPILCAFSITYCGVLRTNVRVPDRLEYRIHRLVRFVAFTLLTAVGCSLLWGWKADGENALTVLRNTLFLVGVSGLLGLIRPVLVWLLPITFVAACVLLGVDMLGEVRWWALVIQPVNHWPAMLVSAGVWLVNLAAVTSKPQYLG